MKFGVVCLCLLLIWEYSNCQAQELLSDSRFLKDVSDATDEYLRAESRTLPQATHIWIALLDPDWFQARRAHLGAHMSYGDLIEDIYRDTDSSDREVSLDSKALLSQREIATDAIPGFMAALTYNLANSNVARGSIAGFSNPHYLVDVYSKVIPLTTSADTHQQMEYTSKLRFLADLDGGYLRIQGLEELLPVPMKNELRAQLVSLMPPPRRDAISSITKENQALTIKGTFRQKERVIRSRIPVSKVQCHNSERFLVIPKRRLCK